MLLFQVIQSQRNIGGVAVNNQVPIDFFIDTKLIPSSGKEGSADYSKNGWSGFVDGVQRGVPIFTGGIANVGALSFGWGAGLYPLIDAVTALFRKQPNPLARENRPRNQSAPMMVIQPQDGVTTIETTLNCNNLVYPIKVSGKPEEIIENLRKVQKSCAIESAAAPLDSTSNLFSPATMPTVVASDQVRQFFSAEPSNTAKAAETPKITAAQQQQLEARVQKYDELLFERRSTEDLKVSLTHLTELKYMLSDPNEPDHVKGSHKRMAKAEVQSLLSHETFEKAQKQFPNLKSKEDWEYACCQRALADLEERKGATISEFDRADRLALREAVYPPKKNWFRRTLHI